MNCFNLPKILKHGISLSMALMAIASNSMAQTADLSIVGTLTPKRHALSTETSPSVHPTLLHIRLSQKAKDALALRLHQKPIMASLDEMHHKQLGMNGVPVLNQGHHGSCVTFANTAAIEAALGLGDYISQLCQLELGQYLENNSYIPSGWNGSFAFGVLNQIQMFGIVSKETESSQGCAGLKDYPLRGQTPGNELSLIEFHQLSEPCSGLRWTSLLQPEDMVSRDFNHNELLAKVKYALNHGNRVTFGVLLPVYEDNSVGAIAMYREKNDTWVLTPSIIKSLESSEDFGGHEMVITGFDDRAVASDPSGKLHRGLLTLRSSWGEMAGDKGDFYMSYQYFKALTVEAQVIHGDHTKLEN